MKTATPRQVHSTPAIDKILYTAAHFGFMPVEAPRVSDADRQVARELADLELEKRLGKNLFDMAERAAFIRSSIEKSLTPDSLPLTVSYKRNDSRRPEYSLHVIGQSTGLAEALLMRSALSLLTEEGHDHLVVDLNCIGDKDSIAAYERELHTYARTIAPQIPEELRPHLKKDIFNLIKISHPETNEIRANAPSSIAFLSSQSRNHFKEVLEYLDILGIEFRLAPELLGHKNFCSHTLFAIKNIEDTNEKLLALGYRYSRLGKQFGLKKEIPFAGVTLFKDALRETAVPEKKVYKELPKPKFYLIQLGNEAKMRALSIIELLRTNRIPVYHLLGRDKLTAQIVHAEALKVPYIIIIGHKEALDNTATIRNTSTRAQDTIPLKDLPYFLKHLPI